MLIENIEIQAENDAFSYVVFRSSDTAISVHCRSDQGGRQRLFLEAVRQLRRMPEFRTGAKRISFAPGLMDPT